MIHHLLTERVGYILIGALAWVEIILTLVYWMMNRKDET